MHPVLVEYVRNIEEETLPAMRRDLADMKTGSLRIQSAKQPGLWVDQTPDYISRLEKGMAEYEDIIAKLKVGETP